MDAVNIFEIWSEGFSITGDRSEAFLIGKAEGITFEEACKSFRDEDGKPLALDSHYEHPSIWACRLYDNEKEARKSFG